METRKGSCQWMCCSGDVVVYIKYTVDIGYIVDMEDIVDIVYIGYMVYMVYRE